MCAAAVQPLLQIHSGIRHTAMPACDADMVCCRCCCCGLLALCSRDSAGDNWNNLQCGGVQRYLRLLHATQ